MQDLPIYGYSEFIPIIHAGRRVPIKPSTTPPSSAGKSSRPTALSLGSNDDELWSDTLSPLLDALAQAKSAEDWATCGTLSSELHDTLDKANMFQRKSKPKHRAPILKICFRLLDCAEAKAVLPIIKIILKLRVGGNNLRYGTFRIAKQIEKLKT